LNQNPEPPAEPEALKPEANKDFQCHTGDDDDAKGLWFCESHVGTLYQTSDDEKLAFDEGRAGVDDHLSDGP
jgi:hypothetical protein